ncbi:MAG: hypothetical protein JRN26_04340 [Nitrososphaerota archaeon]|jgi:hypothetical protein|nr:hypothetical protein [Nitrososphaerota archaeon]MDG6932536.1 hypothetical protein [Nitrososphaerota archaeon]MDG6936093.1 hypothetical protein [Nitrososphaerota archaeon]MDG6944529.1 hypothetical protein [Nitrososphaerota archaeon]
MKLPELTKLVADTLKEFDSQRPIYKNYRPGIGPFAEVELLKRISYMLEQKGHVAIAGKRTPDLEVDNEWALEFKIARPFGDNGREAENWSVNLLHPYRGNISAIGDIYKLMDHAGEFKKEAIFVVGYEHQPPRISLDPLLEAFEAITQHLKLPIGPRIEERRDGLIHPVHQVVRCVSWEVLPQKNYAV